jgi:hypothetical protein
VYVGLREWYAQGALNTTHNATVTIFARDNMDPARADALKRYAETAAAYPYTHTATLARDTVHSLLLAEIARIDGWLAQATNAETTMQIEATLGRAESHLRRLDGIAYEGESRMLWDESRDRLRSRIAKLLER